MTLKDRVTEKLREEGYHWKEEQGVMTVMFDDPVVGANYPCYQIVVTEQKITGWMVDENLVPIGRALEFSDFGMFSYWLDM